jgi:hypothetical protein
MWTLRDLWMYLNPEYKQRMMEQYARQLNNEPARNSNFINDANGYNLEDLFRMHPQRELLMNQWDKMNKPDDNTPFYMRVQRPPPYRGML